MRREQLRARFISSDFFDVLGVNPAIGRTFAPGEDAIGAAPIAMISGGLWKRKFGSSPEVLGEEAYVERQGLHDCGRAPGEF